MKLIQTLSVAAMLVLAGHVLAVSQTQPSIDDLLNLKPPEVKHPEAKPTKPETTADSKPPGTVVPIDPEVVRKLTGEEASDLLEKALAEMNDASERLGKELDAGVTTQRVQEGVLAKLDQVIAAVEQQQSQGGKGQPSQARPQDSGSKGGPPKPGDKQAGPSTTGGAAPTVVGEHAGPIRPIEENKNEWGNLPPRLRDELRQAQDERFSPIYREMTERYYKSLAEEGK